MTAWLNTYTHPLSDCPQNTLFNQNPLFYLSEYMHFVKKEKKKLPSLQVGVEEIFELNFMWFLFVLYFIIITIYPLL